MDGWHCLSQGPIVLHVCSVHAPLPGHRESACATLHGRDGKPSDRQPGSAVTSASGLLPPPGQRSTKTLTPQLRGDLFVLSGTCQSIGSLRTRTSRLGERRW